MTLRSPFRPNVSPSAPRVPPLQNGDRARSGKFEGVNADADADADEHGILRSGTLPGL
jgi:hypothetical protein